MALVNPQNLASNGNPYAALTKSLGNVFSYYNNKKMYAELEDKERQKIAENKYEVEKTRFINNLDKQVSEGGLTSEQATDFWNKFKNTGVPKDATKEKSGLFGLLKYEEKQKDFDGAMENVSLLTRNVFEEARTNNITKQNSAMYSEILMKLPLGDKQKFRDKTASIPKSLEPEEYKKQILETMGISNIATQQEKLTDLNLRKITSNVKVEEGTEESKIEQSKLSNLSTQQNINASKTTEEYNKKRITEMDNKKPFKFVTNPDGNIVVISQNKEGGFEEDVLGKVLINSGSGSDSNPKLAGKYGKVKATAQKVIDDLQKEAFEAYDAFAKVPNDNATYKQDKTIIDKKVEEIRERINEKATYIRFLDKLESRNVNVDISEESYKKIYQSIKGQYQTQINEIQKREDAANVKASKRPERNWTNLWLFKNMSDEDKKLKRQASAEAIQLNKQKKELINKLDFEMENIIDKIIAPSLADNPTSTVNNISLTQQSKNNNEDELLRNIRGSRR